MKEHRIQKIQRRNNPKLSHSGFRSFPLGSGFSNSENQGIGVYYLAFIVGLARSCSVACQCDAKELKLILTPADHLQNEFTRRSRTHHFNSPSRRAWLLLIGFCQPLDYEKKSYKDQTSSTRTGHQSMSSNIQSKRNQCYLGKLREKIQSTVFLGPHTNIA